MMKAFRIIFFVVFATLTSVATLAQTVISPYSKYGYGLLGDNATGIQRSMGGIGYALSGASHVNAMNPASYAATDSLTFLFDMGFDLTNLRASEINADGDKVSGRKTGGGLDYITMQFRVSKNMGMSLGLVPYSSVGYDFRHDIENGIEYRGGDGGINMFYAGYGARPVKGLSLGFNFGYLFGSCLNNTFAYGTSTTIFQRTIKVRDWTLQFGLQYNHKFNRRHQATVGVVYTPAKSFHGYTWGTYYDAAQDALADSVDYKPLKGINTAPATYGIGLSYTYADVLTAEVDFTYQPWSKAKFSSLAFFDPIDQELKFNDRFKVAAGLQYTPNPRGGYLSRATYRLGANFNRDYLQVMGNSVRNYGISCGVSLPTPSSKTIVNIGFEYMKRTSSPKSLVSESYINITLGVTFNELWFWQEKIR